jgi:modification methylase
MRDSDEETDETNNTNDTTIEPPRKMPRFTVPARTAVLRHGDCVRCMQEMSNDSCTLVIADPPYDGVVNASWDRVHDRASYVKFTRQWVAEAIRILRPGGALLIYGSPERNWIARLAIMLEDEFGETTTLVQHLSWIYKQGGGARVSTQRKYAVQHELLLWVEKRGGLRTFNSSEGVEHYHADERATALAKGKGRVSDESLDRGRPARSFLDFARENSRSKERSYGHHPSMKPLALCEHLIKVHSCVDDVVFVSFAGSGSELLAAAALGRRALGAELDASYVELMKLRFSGHNLILEVR